MSTSGNSGTMNNIDFRIFATKDEMGAAAASQGAEQIRQAIAGRGEAHIVVATGASQFETLSALVDQPGIPWDRVTAFHLDEYIGLTVDHPASFRLYLWQRFVSQLPLPLRAFHCINGEGDPEAECRRLTKLIDPCEIDVAFLGIGENCHLAFNDPPADFATEDPYLVVELDEDCRRQQLGEGWFPTLDDVPKTAISMSVRQIMKSRSIVCTVPDSRKANAVDRVLQGDVTPSLPASILQHHEQVAVFLDEPAATQLLKV